MSTYAVSGFPSRQFHTVRSEDVDPELLCLICNDSWDDPLELAPCGHIFCRRCLDEVRQRIERQREREGSSSSSSAATNSSFYCPQCATEVTREKPPNRVLINAALEVKVECRHCHWQGSREHSSHHSCPSGTSGRESSGNPPHQHTGSNSNTNTSVNGDSNQSSGGGSGGGAAAAAGNDGHNSGNHLLPVRGGGGGSHTLRIPPSPASTHSSELPPVRRVSSAADEPLPANRLGPGFSLGDDDDEAAPGDLPRPSTAGTGRRGSRGAASSGGNVSGSGSGAVAMRASEPLPPLPPLGRGMTPRGTTPRGATPHGSLNGTQTSSSPPRSTNGAGGLGSTSGFGATTGGGGLLSSSGSPNASTSGSPSFGASSPSFAPTAGGGGGDRVPPPLAFRTAYPSNPDRPAAGGGGASVPPPPPPSSSSSPQPANPRRLIRAADDTDSALLRNFQNIEEDPYGFSVLGRGTSGDDDGQTNNTNNGGNRGTNGYSPDGAANSSAGGGGGGGTNTTTTGSQQTPLFGFPHYGSGVDNADSFPNADMYDYPNHLGMSSSTTGSPTVAGGGGGGAAGSGGGGGPAHVPGQPLRPLQRLPSASVASVATAPAPATRAGSIVGELDPALVGYGANGGGGSYGASPDRYGNGNYGPPSGRVGQLPPLQHGDAATNGGGDGGGGGQRRTEPWREYGLTQMEYDQIMGIFMSFDEGNSGRLTFPQLRSLCTSLNYMQSEADIAQMFSQMDTQHVGSLSLHQFCLWLRDHRPDSQAMYGMTRFEYNDAIMQFRSADPDNVGTLGWDAFQRLCQSSQFAPTLEQAWQLFQYCDVRKCGYVLLVDYLATIGQLRAGIEAAGGFTPGTNPMTYVTLGASYPRGQRPPLSAQQLLTQQALSPPVALPAQDALTPLANAYPAALPGPSTFPLRNSSNAPSPSAHSQQMSFSSGNGTSFARPASYTVSGGEHSGGGGVVVGGRGGTSSGGVVSGARSTIGGSRAVGSSSASYPTGGASPSPAPGGGAVSAGAPAPLPLRPLTDLGPPPPRGVKRRFGGGNNVNGGNGGGGAVGGEPGSGLNEDGGRPAKGGECVVM